MASNPQTAATTKTDWQLTDGHGYILNRDRSHAAAARLNLQHYLWTSALGYTIHPTILPLLPATATVADVACGSGTWLIAASRQLPHAQLHGFDLEPRQAPHASWLPQNVSVRYLNLLEEVPEELVGRYDYVHTRLLVCVVEDKDPRPILQKLRMMLRPGGWLQWDELDTVNMCVKKVDPGLRTPALEQLRVWSWAEGRHEWTVQLGEFCAEEGFGEVKVDFVGDRDELAKAFNEQHLLTAEEFAEGLVKLGKKEAAAKYFRLVQEAYEESVGGAALCVPRIVCVAQKPL